MKNLKLILVVATVTVLAVATIGVVFAHNYGESYYGMMGYSTDYEDDDWWNEMRDRMEDHWDEIQDEEWFDDMQAYMDNHLDDVEDQDWFDEMTQFMEDRWSGQDGYSRSSGFRGYGGCHG